jgi:hypothetical protein
VNDAATFSDEDLRSFPGPVASVALLPAVVTPDAAAAFVGDALVPPAADCFQTRRRRMRWRRPWRAWCLPRRESRHFKAREREPVGV